MKKEEKVIQSKFNRVWKPLHSFQIINRIKADWDVSRNPKDFGVQRAISSRDPWAGKWIFANLNNINNILEDQCAQDEYDKLARFHPFLPVCNWCGCSAINTPSEDHAVSCTYKYLNRSVGIQVQNSFVKVLKLFERVKMGEPKLSESLWFDHIDSSDLTEYRGDVAAFHEQAGHEVHLDVAWTGTFDSTIPSRNLKLPPHTVVKVEARKTNTYSKRMTYPPDCMVFVAIDSCGAMGPSGNAYMMEAFETLKNQQRCSRGRRLITPQGDDEPSWQVKKSKESLSLDICRANYEYMLVCRSGKLKNGLNQIQAKEKSAANKLKRQEEEAKKIQAEILSMEGLLSFF